MYFAGKRIASELSLISQAANRSSMVQEAIGWIQSSRIQGFARMRAVCEGAWIVKQPSLPKDAEAKQYMELIKLVDLRRLKSGSLAIVKLA